MAKTKKSLGTGDAAQMAMNRKQVQTMIALERKQKAKSTAKKKPKK